MRSSSSISQLANDGIIFSEFNQAHLVVMTDLDEVTYYQSRKDKVGWRWESSWKNNKSRDYDLDPPSKSKEQGSCQKVLQRSVLLHDQRDSAKGIFQQAPKFLQINTDRNEALGWCQDSQRLKKANHPHLLCLTPDAQMQLHNWEKSKFLLLVI